MKQILNYITLPRHTAKNAAPFDLGQATLS